MRKSFYYISLLSCLLCMTFLSCSQIGWGGVDNNSSISFSIDTSRAANTDSTLKVSVKLLGDYTDSSEVSVKAGETAKLEFKAVPVGKKIYAEAEIAVDDIPLYSGESEEIVVKPGTNILPLKLKKLTQTTEGEIILETDDFIIQIDSETSSLDYLNDYKIVLKATDKDDNAITDDITWSASLLYGDTDLNIDNPYYTFDEESATISVAKDTVGFGVPLWFTGPYQLYVKAEYNDKTYSANYQIEFSNAYKFVCDAGNSAQYEKMLDQLADFSGYVNAKVYGTGVTTENDEDGYVITPGTMNKVASVIRNDCDLDFSELTEVTAVGGREFYSMSIKSIKLPAAITSIGSNAFYSCRKITEITIPASVQSIESSAFYYCTSLEKVNFNEGLITIGASAFEEDAELTSIKIPSTVKIIYSDAFKHCVNLTSVIFVGNTQISAFGQRAFYNTGLDVGGIELSGTWKKFVASNSDDYAAWDNICKYILGESSEKPTIASPEEVVFSEYSFKWDSNGPYIYKDIE